VHCAGDVPLRIVTRVEKNGTALVLDGWLSGPEVDEFEAVAESASLPLRVDLAHVKGADAAGVAALHAQQARGAALTNASPYIELLLHAYAGAGREHGAGRRDG